MQRVVGPGDTVQLDNERWEVQAVANNVFSLLNLDTGEMQNLSLAAISRRLDLPPIFDRSIAEAGKLDFNLNERERLDYWVPRIQEIIFGKPDGAHDFRHGFDPETTSQGQRLTLLLGQLNDAGIKVGTRTLERYVSSYKNYGPAGLIDRRTTAKHGPLDGLSEEVLAAIDAMIEDRMYKSSVPYLVQVANVRALLRERFPNPTFKTPVRERIIAAIKEKTKGQDLAGSAKRRRSADNVPLWTYRGMQALMPGSETQIDPSRYDVRARKPDGTPGSFTLTVLMDKCTRSVLAAVVMPTGQGGAHAYLLAQAMTPAEARPGVEGFVNPWAFHGKVLPWAELLDPENAAKWETRRPIVRIFRVLTDNGKDYTSRVFASACRQLGIILTVSAIRSPTDKAMVEHFFETLKEQFIAHLPGNTGGDLSLRGEDVDAEDLLSVEDLAVLLDRWITQIWQNRPMDGLRDPLNPSAKAVSPNVMYASMFPFVGHVPLALTEADYISLLPMESRTLQKDGIGFKRRMYDSDDLARIRMSTSGDGKLDGQWEIHYKPTDPKQIWVYVPAEDRYVLCPLKESRFDNPHLSSYWRLAHEMYANGYVIPDAETAEVSGNFIRNELARIRREEKQQATNELAERLADVQNLGGIGARTNLTVQPGQPRQEDEDWDEVPEVRMEAFGGTSSGSRGSSTDADV